MNAAPFQLRSGDYVMNFPVERPSDRDTARQVMRRNGCRAIRFECHGITVPDENGKQVEAKTMVAHGYVGRMTGPGVEEL